MDENDAIDMDKDPSKSKNAFVIAGIRTSTGRLVQASEDGVDVFKGLIIEFAGYRMTDSYVEPDPDKMEFGCLMIAASVVKDFFDQIKETVEEMNQ